MRNSTVFKHGGYLMRSFAETRWARIFESLDISYLYEPHLLKVQGGMYLPDFYLPHADAYVEVKGPSPTEEERRKAEDVMSATGRQVFFVFGKPDADRHGLFNCCGIQRGRDKWFTVSGHEVDQMVLQAMGRNAWIRLLSGARPHDMPNLASVGELADEVYLSFMDRPDQETYRRMHQQRVNGKKLENMPPPTTAEIGLRWWIGHCASRLAQQDQSDLQEVR